MSINSLEQLLKVPSMYIIPHSLEYFEFLGVENVTIFTTGSLINKQCSFWLVLTKFTLTNAECKVS